MIDQVENLYYCDGKIEKCVKDPFSICYKKGGPCTHTKDISHRRKMLVNGMELPTKMIEWAPNIYAEVLPDEIESVLFKITQNV